MKRVTALYRLFFVGLIIVAVLGQFIYKHPQGLVGITSFFSYFTILSNLLAALVFICLATGRKTVFGVAIDVLRPAVVVYMAITGIVVILILEKYMSFAVILPWANDVLHRIMPVVVAADWLINPPKKKIKFKTAFYWLVFPLIFVGYTLVRGPMVGNWYPYPFLDPNDAGGYCGIDC